MDYLARTKGFGLLTGGAERGKTTVIIIDEANYINNAILNDLKILFNFEMDSRDRAAILLVGLPKLNSTLRLAIHDCELG